MRDDSWRWLLACLLALAACGDAEEEGSVTGDAEVESSVTGDAEVEGSVTEDTVMPKLDVSCGGNVCVK